jgi:hypothetical protein
MQFFDGRDEKDLTAWTAVRDCRVHGMPGTAEFSAVGCGRQCYSIGPRKPNLSVRTQDCPV